MRSWVMAMAAVAGLGLGGFPGEAQACPEERLVQTWYMKYLHRPVDPAGLDAWVQQMRCGLPALSVEAAILGSEEYWCTHGHSPHGFVAGLYEDVLGRRACPEEVHFWVCRLQRCGCRKALAKAFLCETRKEMAGPPPGAPFYPPGGPVDPGYGPPRPVPGFEPPAGVSLRLRYSRR